MARYKRRLFAKWPIQLNFAIKYGKGPDVGHFHSFMVHGFPSLWDLILLGYDLQSLQLQMVGHFYSVILLL